MARKHVIMRVSALSLAGGALLLYSSETGRVPEAQVTPADPGATVSAEWERGSVSGPHAATHGLALPGNAGFRTAPETPGHGWQGATWDAGASARPAAFAPAPDPGLPDGPPPRPETEAQETFSPLGLPCGLDVTAAAIDHATIALGVAAPCEPGARLDIRHAGLTIGARTDAVGILTLDLPAFESPAVVTVRLPDGTEAEARVEIPDLDAYDRVALAWAGDLGLELQAMEGDAGWREAGHVHPGAMRGLAALDAGAGHMVELGTAAGKAQIYTRPRKAAAAEAGVVISVDAPVTPGNCTRKASASVLRMEAGGPVETTPLRFTYPDCDAVGDILVLQNALRDMRLAAN
ncbi:MAG: hypothetical protein ACOCYW_09125 [Roseicyclus sp.]